MANPYEQMAKGLGQAGVNLAGDKTYNDPPPTRPRARPDNVKPIPRPRARPDNVKPIPRPRARPDNVKPLPVESESVSIPSDSDNIYSDYSGIQVPLIYNDEPVGRLLADEGVLEVDKRSTLFNQAVNEAQKNTSENLTEKIKQYANPVKVRGIDFDIDILKTITDPKAAIEGAKAKINFGTYNNILENVYGEVGKDKITISYEKSFAEGGKVENSAQLEMDLIMNEQVDPVSGNTAPVGAKPEEVRDDIEIRISPGEYVINAQTVRYFGEDFFDELQKTAAEGFERIKEGEELPFRDDELEFEEN